MRADDVKIGGMIPVLIEDIPHHGIRLSNDVAGSQLNKLIPDHLVAVAIHHKRSLSYAVVAVNADTEFEFDEADVNPYRQMN